MAAENGVESAAKELERVAKKQKTCTARTADALGKLVKVGRPAGPARAPRLRCGSGGRAAAGTRRPPARYRPRAARRARSVRQRTPGRDAQALEGARSRLAAMDPAANPGAALAELRGQLASLGTSTALAAETKDLHGAVAKLGKVGRGSGALGAAYSAPGMACSAGFLIQPWLLKWRALIVFSLTRGAKLACTPWLAVLGGGAAAWRKWPALRRSHS